MIVAHHIVIDGWSLPLFVSELLALYRAGGDTAALPPSPAAVSRLHRLAGRPGPGGQPRIVGRAPDGLDGPTLLSPALTGDPADRRAFRVAPNCASTGDATTALADGCPSARGHPQHACSNGLGDDVVRP